MAKKMYIGRISQVPIYEQQLVDVPKTVKVTPQNNAEFFTTNNGNWNDGEFHLGNCTTTASTIATLVAKKDMSVSFTVYYNGGYENDTDYPDYDSECWVKVNGAVIASATSSLINKAWSGAIKAGQTIEVYNHTGSSMCEDVFLQKFSVTHTVKEMQQVQVGSETRDAARRVRRQYVSVDGKARRVRKAYVGVNGKARLVFTSGCELLLSGKNAAPLSIAKSQHAAASVGKYAVFAGGETTSPPQMPTIAALLIPIPKVLGKPGAGWRPQMSGGNTQSLAVAVRTARPPIQMLMMAASQKPLSPT